MDDTTKNLEQRVAALEELLSAKGINFEEAIRNTVFFDNDMQTVTTHTVNVVGGMGGTVTAPKNPDFYLRAYYRGKVYNVPVYNTTS